jgi:glutathione peroxidase
LYEQYLDWNAHVEEYGEQGFDALAIPTNNFGLQEPGANSELLNGLEHVRPGDGFKPVYRLAGKTNANGANENALFTYLKERCPNPQNTVGDTSSMYWTPVKQTDITWNFEKFLVDHEGKVYRRYVPAMNPMNPTIRQDIEALLERKKAADEAKAKETKEAEAKDQAKPETQPKFVPKLSHVIQENLQKMADKDAAIKLTELKSKVQRKKH